MSAFISLTLAALLAAPAAPAAPASPRFAVTGSLTKAPASLVDSRFQIEASARIDETLDAGGGRFALKSINGSNNCDGSSDIFHNGFE